MAFWTVLRWPCAVPSTNWVSAQLRAFFDMTVPVHRIDARRGLFRWSTCHLGLLDTWYRQNDQCRLVTYLLCLLVEEVRLHRHIVDGQHCLRVEHVHRTLPYANIVHSIADLESAIPSTRCIALAHLSTETSTRAS